MFRHLERNLFSCFPFISFLFVCMYVCVRICVQYAEGVDLSPAVSALSFFLVALCYAIIFLKIFFPTWFQTALLTCTHFSELRPQDVSFLSVNNVVLSVSFVASALCVPLLKCKRDIGFLLTFTVLYCCAWCLAFEVTPWKLAFLTTWIFSHQCRCHPELLALLKRKHNSVLSLTLLECRYCTTSKILFNHFCSFFVILSVSITVSQILPCQLCAFFDKARPRYAREPLLDGDKLYILSLGLRFFFNLFACKFW